MREVGHNVITRHQPRLVALDAIRVNLTIVRNLIHALSEDEAFRRLVRDDPQRWEPLVEALDDGLDAERPGSLAALLRALFVALEG